MTIGTLIAAGVVGWLVLAVLVMALCRAAAVQDTQRYRRTNGTRPPAGAIPSPDRDRHGQPQSPRPAPAARVGPLP